MKALLKSIRPRQRRLPDLRIQLLSDLHLEIGQQYSSYTFPATAPFLLLGGDIGRLIDYEGYLKFLEAQAARYEKVFLVLGNHEFYCLDYESGVESARRLSAEPSLANHIVLLHRTRWDDPNSTLTIVGCTLWSAIPDEACSVVESKINDFKKIDQWSTQKHNEIHAKEVAWLRDAVNQVTVDQNAARQLIVATHHAPCMQGTSRAADSANPWTCAFATDLLNQQGWHGVKVWMFGHTHYSTAFQKNGIKLVANQRGYVLPGSSVPKTKQTKAKSSANKFNSGLFITL